MRLSVSKCLALPGLLLFGLFLAACGQPPVPAGQQSPVSTPPQTPGRALSELPDGHPTGVRHPGLENTTPGDATFSGAVEMKGKMASLGGFLFVNVFPEGLRMPCFSRKFDLTREDPAITVVEGTRVVTFHLDERYALGGLVPGPLVIEAAYDPDGYVDTMEPERKTVQQSVTANASSITLVLE